MTKHTERVTVTLPKRILEAVDNDLVGSIGKNRADAIATALAIYLSERGHLEGGIYNER